jgi:hypothetical protein
MAPKPKKNANQPYKPSLYDQYQNRRSFLIDTAETPADIKNLQKDLAKAKADYLNAKKDKQSRAAGTGYNPGPMSAAAKAKAGARGKATATRTKPKSTASKVAGVAGKVAGRAVGLAKSKVKADIKIAKTVGDFAVNALTKQPRTRQMYRQVGKSTPIKKLMDSSDKATKKKK